MAAGKKSREIQFTLNDDDFKMFGHYRILYTDQGHKLVRRHSIRNIWDLCKEGTKICLPANCKIL